MGFGFTFSIFQFYYWVGFVMIGYGIGFVGNLTVEAPFANLTNMMLICKIYILSYS